MITEKNIPYPDDETIARSIQKIVDVSVPERKGICFLVWEMISSLGLKYLFFAMKDVLLLSLLCTLGLSALFTADAFVSKQVYFLPCIFVSAPVFFICFELFSWIKDTSDGILPLTVICRFSSSEISAMQMLVASSVSLALTVLLGFVMRHYLGTGIETILIPETAYLALMIYSCGTLVFERSSYSSKKIMMPAVWLLVSLVVKVFPSAMNAALFSLHSLLGLTLMTLVSLLAVYLFIRNLKKAERGERVYAVD